MLSIVAIKDARYDAHSHLQMGAMHNVFKRFKVRKEEMEAKEEKKDPEENEQKEVKEEKKEEKPSGLRKRKIDEIKLDDDDEGTRPRKTPRKK